MELEVQGTFQEQKHRGLFSPKFAFISLLYGYQYPSGFKLFNYVIWLNPHAGKSKRIMF